jgi:hypothetical protein
MPALSVSVSQGVSTSRVSSPHRSTLNLICSCGRLEGKGVSTSRVKPNPQVHSPSHLGEGGRAAAAGVRRVAALARRLENFFRLLSHPRALAVATSRGGPRCTCCTCCTRCTCCTCTCTRCRRRRYPPRLRRGRLALLAGRRHPGGGGHGLRHETARRTGDAPGQRMQHYGFASPLDAPPWALIDSGEGL